MFTRVHVDACDKPECQETEATGRIQVNTQCQQHSEDVSRWMVTLHLTANQADGEECPPYTFDIEVVGFFHLSDEYPEEKRAAMLKVNAPAVLFGAMREMVANITARGPYPRFDLPTVTFIDEAQPNEKTEKSSET